MSFAPNINQQHALNAPLDSTVCIIAGAGTGKTETLANRYVKILTETPDLHPRNIVVLTFTEKAATEMRARMMYKVAQDPNLNLSRVDMAEAHISTFHAFAARLVLSQSIALNLDPDEPFCEERDMLLIADECWERFLAYGWEEAYAHLYSLVDNFDWNDDSHAKTIAQMLADAKGMGFENAQLAQRLAQTMALSDAHALLGQAMQWNFVARSVQLSQQGQIDLDDLINVIPWLIGQFPHLCADIRFVMVDEYQDTSAVQANLLGSITPHTNAQPSRRTVVGDPRQAIYLWRQAQVQNIIDIREASTHKIDLIENHRSFKPILDLANIGLNSYQFATPPEFDRTKTLAPARHDPDNIPADCVRYYRYVDQAAEATAIAARMQELHTNYGVAYGDMAILLRRRNHLDVYADAMQQAGIPFDRGKNNPFYERPLILDAIHTAIAIIDPSNELALTRALLQATATIDDIGLAHMRQQHRDVSLWQMLLAYQHDITPIGTFVQRRQHLAAQQWQLAPAEWLHTMVHACGLWQRDGAYGQRMLTKLINDCRTMPAANVPDLLGQLVERMRDDPESAAPELKTDTNAVQIMTVHAAKGLEFAAVFIPDAHAFTLRAEKNPTFQPGYLVDPTHPDATQHRMTHELERQHYNELLALWYVALTRAKHWLMVSAHVPSKNNNSQFTVTFDYLQQLPIAGVDCRDIEIVPSFRAQPLPMTSSVNTTHTDPLPYKRIINLSPSAIHELTQCPRRYRFQRRSGLDVLYSAEYDESVYVAQSVTPASGQYVLPQSYAPASNDNAPEPDANTGSDDPEQQGANARILGTLFHAAVEAHAGLPNGTAADLVAAAVQRYGQAVSQAIQSELLTFVQRYLDSPLGKQAPQPHQVEQRIRWQIDMPAAVVELSGVIDRLTTTQIIDFKTDLDSAGISTRHGDQLRLYAHAIMQQQAATQPSELVVYHVRSGEQITIANDPPSMHQTMLRLEKAVQHIVNSDYPAVPRADYCIHCPARVMCPEGSLK
jgi:ATP-dependent exoDNAse (exonuclease V) beta subunit